MMGRLVKRRIPCQGGRIYCSRKVRRPRRPLLEPIVRSSTLTFTDICLIIGKLKAADVRGPQ